MGKAGQKKHMQVCSPRLPGAVLLATATKAPAAPHQPNATGAPPHLQCKTPAGWLLRHISKKGLNLKPSCASSDDQATIARLSYTSGVYSSLRSSPCKHCGARVLEAFAPLAAFLQVTHMWIRRETCFDGEPSRTQISPEGSDPLAPLALNVIMRCLLAL